jgi:AcrR family transcriptional regulator
VSVPARRGRPGHDLESVLAAAVELFNDRGYDATTVDDLARRLGLTKSAIYHHVTGKQQLLRLAVDRALGPLLALTERLDPARPAVRRLEELVRGSVAVLISHLPYVTVLLRVRGNTAVGRDALARRRDLDRIVADLVAAAARDGDIRPDVDPATTSRLLFGMVNSLVEWYRPRPASDPAELADAVVRVAFDGIRTAPPGGAAGPAGDRPAR